MIEPDGPAPYAPPTTVMSVIQRHRQVAIAHFDVAVLGRIGVLDSLAPRTLQGLRLLGLVDDDGRPTEAFERLRKSPTSDFEATLADVVRTAYSSVFAIVDPSSATVEQVEDAFRHFTPAGQRRRMVTLFLGLLSEASIPGPMGDGAPIRRSPKAKRSAVVKKPSKTESAVERPRELSEPATATPQPARYDEGDTYRVQLQSGGAVSIVMDVNLFRLSVDDRAFVIDLVDRMKGYGTNGQEVSDLGVEVQPTRF